MYNSPDFKNSLGDTEIAHPAACWDLHILLSQMIFAFSGCRHG
jgi:hypothetical protein